MPGDWSYGVKLSNEKLESTRYSIQLSLYIASANFTVFNEYSIGNVCEFLHDL